MKYSFILLLVLTVLTSCNSINPTLKKQLITLSHDLEEVNPHKLEEICTAKGYQSFMSFTDALKSRVLIENLSHQLENPEQGIFNVEYYNSLIYLSLGKPDPMLGASDGYLVLKEVNDQVKIEAFVPSK